MAASRRPERVRADRTVITPELYEMLQGEAGALRVIIDLNPDYPRGLSGAETTVRLLIEEAATHFGRVDPFEDARLPRDRP
jgi:hypothetical protein